MHLYNNIKYLRKRARLNQSELGDAVGKTHAVIGAYESGRNQPPLDALIALADFFQVNIDDFIFKDLSVEEANPYEKKEASVNEQLLIELLHKRVKLLEAEFKKMDPERAKNLGIE